MSDYPDASTEETLPLFAMSSTVATVEEGVVEEKGGKEERLKPGLQQELFENPQAPKPAVSRQVSRDTRREAYEGAQGRAPEQRMAVLQCIREASAEGVTRKEIAERLDMLLQSICPRVRELLKPTDGSPPQVFQDGKRNGSAVLKAKGHV